MLNRAGHSFDFFRAECETIDHRGGERVRARLRQILLIRLENGAGLDFQLSRQRLERVVLARALSELQELCLKIHETR